MCYYNGQKVAKPEFIRLKHLEKLLSKYEFLDRDIQVGFDFGPLAVLKPIPGEEDFEIVQMEWGFIPDPLRWPFIETREQANKVRRGYTDPRGRYQEPLNFLNAVSEELVAPNKVYRDAALHRRCIVISSGFFEWRHIFPPNKRTGQPVKTAVKYPYHITVKERDWFPMAAIWQPWTDAETGEHVDTCSIVTTQANEVMEQIHNSKKRMPSILDDDLAWEWLFGKPDEKRVSEIARRQIPWQELNYHNLAKNFLSSHEPLKEVVYPELIPLQLPGEDAQEAGQLQLF